MGLIFDSLAFTIDQREEYGFFNHSQAEAERRRLQADIIAANEVNRIIKTQDTGEIQARLKSLRSKYDAFLNK